MASFATVDDLSAFTGQTLNATQAQQALNMATALIQAETGQYLFQVVDDVIVVDPDAGLSCRLPEAPVTAVSKLEWYDDRSGTGWNTVDPTQAPYRCETWGQLYVLQPNAYTTPSSSWGPWWGWWPTDPQTLRVTYTHGYSLIPQPIQSVCVSVAARLMVNPYGLVSQRTGALQNTFMGPGGFLLDIERTALDRFSTYGLA